MEAFAKYEHNIKYCYVKDSFLLYGQQCFTGK